MRYVARQMIPAAVNQLQLFRASRDNIDAAFLQFHVANPQVYEALVRMARREKQRGRKRLGMKAMFEVLRYETNLQTSDPSGFRVNNTFTRPYAHLLMAQERCTPECMGGCAYLNCCAGLFETRGVR